MKHRKASPTVLLLIMVFFVSFLVLTCAFYNRDPLLKIPRVNVENVVSFSAFSVFKLMGPGEVSTLLNQTTRMDIFSFVKDNPGFHFRALSDYLSMPIGVLQYHLGLLVNGGLLSSYRDGRYMRYFEPRRFTETEMKIISVLRHETSGKILVSLLEKPQMTHRELAARLNISSQALSWQMNHLEKTGLIKRNVEGLNMEYSLEEAVCTAVSRCATFLFCGNSCLNQRSHAGK